MISEAFVGVFDYWSMYVRGSCFKKAWDVVQLVGEFLVVAARGGRGHKMAASQGV